MAPPSVDTTTAIPLAAAATNKTVTADLPTNTADSDTTGNPIIGIPGGSTTVEAESDEYDSDCYSEAGAEHFGHVDKEHCASSRQQSREFLRRLGVGNSVKLPADSDLLRQRQGQPTRMLVASQISRKE